LCLVDTHKEVLQKAVVHRQEAERLDMMRGENADKKDLVEEVDNDQYSDQVLQDRMDFVAVVDNDQYSD